MRPWLGPESGCWRPLPPTSRTRCLISRGSKGRPMTALIASTSSQPVRKVPMLRDAGVRTKLFALLAIPSVLLLVVTSLLVANQIREARRAGQVDRLTAIASNLNETVHGLQDE